MAARNGARIGVVLAAAGVPKRIELYRPGRGWFPVRREPEARHGADTVLVATGERRPRTGAGGSRRSAERR